MNIPFRIGFGYDLHQLIEGRPLILGGVQIPHTKGLQGHSDADCLTHAIIDALLGAAGLPDIGHFFLDTDPQFKNVDSLTLLEKVNDKLKNLGYSIGNIDSTLIAEAPKINPHIQNMKAKISTVLSIPNTLIGIKATTNEKVDGIGAGHAIAAHAVCLIAKQN